MAFWQDRRLWALGANTAYAAASFLLGYLLLLQGDPTVYGVFAFYLLVQAFAYSLVNALFGAPLLIASRDGVVSPSGLNPMLKLALLLALCCAALQAMLLLLQGMTVAVSAVLAFATVLLLLRWFWRSVQQNEAPEQVIAADLMFSLPVLAGVAMLWFLPAITLETLSGLLLLAALLSLLPALRQWGPVLRAQGDWQLWLQGFRRQGKPALAGVVTVEVSANLHQYLIVLWHGATALAPVAAAGLFLRPMTLVQSSLAQIERPRLARAVGAADWTELRQVTRQLAGWSLLAFLLNVIGLVLVLLWTPAWVWPQQSGLADFVSCAAVVALAALLRSLRGPASIVLQALDQFRFLATVTWRASLLTVPLVLLGLAAGGVPGALLAMLLGECAIAWPILRRCRNCLAHPAAIAQSTTQGR